ncbi:hypothetical protein [Methanomethylovorans sp.]
MEDDKMQMHERMRHNAGQMLMEEHPSHMEEHEHMEHGDQNQQNKYGSKDMRTGHTDHHAMMVKDFRKRFFVSVIITIPVLLLSPVIQEFLFAVFGITVPSFRGDIYILFLLSTVIFFYGGRPFLVGIRQELISHAPGMMTLIAVAITVA